MDFTTSAREAFTIVGIAARTSNSEGGRIAALWQRFYAEGIQQRIPDRLSDDVYSLYTDYESDHTGPFTLVIGCAVSKAEALPDGLVAKAVPAAKYAVIDATGPQPDTVMQQWQAIWASDLPRSYSGDFDLYRNRKGETPRVEIHVAIR
ncbi:GyrI-like domain-containing protein [Rhodospirillaceae bacterium SYSU D60014]|uniref:GyrI-like domain-containing protein n=1 Tax=Virgifigura deserti TaxID=2268457 RepID=UPI000E67040C